MTASPWYRAFILIEFNFITLGNRWHYFILQSRGQTDSDVSRFLQQEHRPSEFTQLLTGFLLPLCQTVHSLLLEREGRNERRKSRERVGRTEARREMRGRRNKESQTLNKKLGVEGRRRMRREDG